MKASLGPHIVLAPSCAVFFSELRERLPKPSGVSISARSTLLVTGEGAVTIESLELDGALHIAVRFCTDFGDICESWSHIQGTVELRFESECFWNH